VAWARMKEHMRAKMNDGGGGTRITGAEAR
jgi:hypothetical protein